MNILKVQTIKFLISQGQVINQIETHEANRILLFYFNLTTRFDRIQACIGTGSVYTYIPSCVLPLIMLSIYWPGRPVRPRPQIASGPLAPISLLNSIRDPP